LSAWGTSSILPVISAWRRHLTKRSQGGLKNPPRLLITRDLDFSDIRRYPTGDYNGIVVLRLPDDAVAAEIVGVIERFVREHRYLDALPGRLAIVEPDRVRFRPPIVQK